MPFKSKEELIYYSDFISLEGRLVIGQKDARETIYPGELQKTLYWNIKQLIKQVERAIDIFEEKYSNKVAVFVFD